MTAGKRHSYIFHDEKWFTLLLQDHMNVVGAVIRNDNGRRQLLDWQRHGLHLVVEVDYRGQRDHGVFYMLRPGGKVMRVRLCQLHGRVVHPPSRVLMRVRRSCIQHRSKNNGCWRDAHAAGEGAIELRFTQHLHKTPRMVHHHLDAWEPEGDLPKLGAKVGVVFGEVFDRLLPC